MLDALPLPSFRCAAAAVATSLFLTACMGAVDSTAPADGTQPDAGPAVEDAGARDAPMPDPLHPEDAATPVPDAGPACEPTTCEEAGASCGAIDDGCGGTLDCGSCALALEMEFDSGSLDVDASAIDGDTVTLLGRDNGNTGRWKWLHFRVRHVRDRALRFEIDDAFASGRDRLRSHEMVYSYDGTTWSFFDSNVLEPGRFRFWNEAPFSEDEVLIAYGLPYPLAMARDLVDAAIASPHARPTASGNASCVVGRSAGGTDDLGRAIPGQPLWGFEIGTGARRVVLAGGVHSNETTGSHTLHGLVTFLLSDAAEAVALRGAATFFVYPMINPDGRLAGYNRHTVEQVSEDPNRQWSSSEWGNNREIRVVANAMRADVGTSGVDYFLDFHSTVGTGAHFAYIDTNGTPTGRDMRDDPFWVALSDRDPIVARDATYSGYTAMRYGWRVLGARFAATVETYFRPGENVGRYRRLGRAMGLSLHDAIVR